MSADVHVLRSDQATPQEVLAHALALAQKGELADVVIVSTFTNGKIDLAYSMCTGQDLAAAALAVESGARKLLDIS